MTFGIRILVVKLEAKDIYEEGAVVFPVLHGPRVKMVWIHVFWKFLKMPDAILIILSSCCHN